MQFSWRYHCTNLYSWPLYIYLFSTVPSLINLAVSHSSILFWDFSLVTQVSRAHRNVVLATVLSVLSFALLCTSLDLQLLHIHFPSQIFLSCFILPPPCCLSTLQDTIFQFSRTCASKRLEFLAVVLTMYLLFSWFTCRPNTFTISINFLSDAHFHFFATTLFHLYTSYINDSLSLVFHSALFHYPVWFYQHIK